MRLLGMIHGILRDYTDTVDEPPLFHHQLSMGVSINIFGKLHWDGRTLWEPSWEPWEARDVGSIKM